MARFRKRCSKCRNIFAQRDSFYPHKYSKDGTRTYCIPCHKERLVAEHAKDPELRRESARKVMESWVGDDFLVYLYCWKEGGWKYIGCSGRKIHARMLFHKSDKRSACYELFKTLGEPDSIQVLGRFPKYMDDSEEDALRLETWSIEVESTRSRRLVNRRGNRRYDKDDILYGQYDEFVPYEEAEAC